MRQPRAGLRVARIDGFKRVGHRIALSQPNKSPPPSANRARYGNEGCELAAGCELVGISDLVTFLEGTSVYRRDQRRAEYGDERQPEMRAYLESISPLGRADRITRPLFVAHGANDPRVPLGEAEQIAAAVRKNGGEVWTMVAPDEGHGFRRRRTRDAFYLHLVAFFERHLAGRVEPAASESGQPPAGR